MPLLACSQQHVVIPQSGRHGEGLGGHTSSAIVVVIKCAKAVSHVGLAIGVICSDVSTLGGQPLEAAAGLPSA